MLQKFQSQRKTKPVKANQPLYDSIEENRVDAPPALLLPIQKTDESPGTQCEACHESAQHRTDGEQRAAENQGQLAYPDQFVDQAGRPGDEQAKIRNGFKKGITSQIHGGNATMILRNCPTSPEPSQRMGTGETEGNGAFLVTVARFSQEW